MQISGFPFTTADWAKVEPTEHKGESGAAYWRTQALGSIRIRMVMDTPGYLADHWCAKGHVIFCIEGTVQTWETPIPETVAEAGERITNVVADAHGDATVKQVSTDGPREVVTDKGYHSGAGERTQRVGLAHVLFGAESWTATVARATAGTTSGVCQSAAHSRRARPPAATPARREAGAMESTLV